MKAHFENIQMIVDSTTLPHAMRCLSISIREEIDVSSVMERLNRGKGVLSQSEKLHLWDQLKILSISLIFFHMCFECANSIYFLLAICLCVCVLSLQVSLGWFCLCGP